MHCMQHQKMDGSKLMARTCISGKRTQREIRDLIIAGYSDAEIIDIGYRANDVLRCATSVISTQATERCRYCGAKAIYLDAYKMCMGCRLKRKQK